MRRSRRARADTHSSILLAAIAASADDRAQHAKLLAVEIEAVSSRMRAHLSEHRRKADAQRRRLFDRLAVLDDELSALATRLEKESE